MAIAGKTCAVVFRTCNFPGLEVPGTRYPYMHEISGNIQWRAPKICTKNSDSGRPHNPKLQQRRRRPIFLLCFWTSSMVRSGLVSMSAGFSVPETLNNCTSLDRIFACIQRSSQSRCLGFPMPRLRAMPMAADASECTQYSLYSPSPCTSIGVP